MNNNIEKKKRQKELTEKLNAASRAYYQEAREILSNYEYDALYDELAALEKETGTVLAGSPTAHVGYEVLSELPKERHESPMLSLDKTKDRDALAAWIGEHRTPAFLEAGRSDHRADLSERRAFQGCHPWETARWERSSPTMQRVFKNVPLRFRFRVSLVLRGEAVIRLSRV